MLLTRKQILDADDLKHCDVEVPEWGGGVRVRVMTGRERLKIQKLAESQKDKVGDGFMESVVLLTAIDEHGNQLFQETDLEQLKGKNVIALEKVFRASCELNGLTKSSVDQIQGE